MGLESFSLGVLSGTALGILTGLGIGGGSLLLLWLTGVLGAEPELARNISLLFFFPSALISCLLSRKNIPWKLLLPGILAGVLSAALFAVLARSLDPELFRKALGLLFLFTGLRELFHRS